MQLFLLTAKWIRFCFISVIAFLKLLYQVKRTEKRVLCCILTSNNLLIEPYLPWKFGSSDKFNAMVDSVVWLKGFSSKLSCLQLLVNFVKFLYCCILIYFLFLLIKNKNVSLMWMGVLWNSQRQRKGKYLYYQKFNKMIYERK